MEKDIITISKMLLLPKRYVLGVVGSKKLNKKKHKEEVFLKLDLFVCANGVPSTVVTGGYKPIDKMVKMWCKENNINVTEYRPRVHSDTGKRLHDELTRRNKDLVAVADVLVAFPMEKGSFDTNQAIKLARDPEKRKRPVLVYTQLMDHNNNTTPRTPTKKTPSPNKKKSLFNPFRISPSSIKIGKKKKQLFC